MPELTIKNDVPKALPARFACRCCGKNWIDLRLKKLVAEIELRIGERLAITSGCRCENHNRAVGGSKTSSHMRGLAVDVACSNSWLRYRILKAAILSEINRIGIYGNFIHLDIDRRKPPRVIWLKS